MAKGKTFDDPTKRTYGHNIPYNPGKCAKAITTPGDWWDHQCKRKPLSPSLYCKLHDPERVEAKRTVYLRVWSLESNERIQRADVDSAARALADSLLEKYDADMLPVASTSEVAAYRRLRVMWEDTRLALHEARQALKEFKS